MKPVRQIKPSNRSITGKHSSKKTSSVHPFESSLERDYLTLLEWDDNITSFVTQPLTINYIFEKQLRRYTPDAIIYYREELEKRPSLCEVKYSDELKQKEKELKPKFDAANEYCLLNGYEFKIVTEKEIRTDLLNNIKFLSSYQNGTIDQRCRASIYAYINKGGFITAEQLRGDGELFTLWQMIAQKELHCDMEKKITMISGVWTKQQQ